MEITNKIGLYESVFVLKKSTETIDGKPNGSGLSGKSKLLGTVLLTVAVVCSISLLSDVNAQLLNDRDNDGIEDASDSCPDDPDPQCTGIPHQEILPGINAPTDAGPKDSDGDGVYDSSDPCPDDFYDMCPSDLPPAFPRTPPDPKIAEENCKKAADLAGRIVESECTQTQTEAMGGKTGSQSGSESHLSGELKVGGAGVSQTTGDSNQKSSESSRDLTYGSNPSVICPDQVEGAKYDEYNQCMNTYGSGEAPYYPPVLPPPKSQYDKEGCNKWQTVLPGTPLEAHQLWCNDGNGHYWLETQGEAAETAGMHPNDP